MPRTVKSPIERWPGTVKIADPMTLPQVEAIEQAMEMPEAVRNAKEDERVWMTAIDAPQIPAILACVEKWELERFPASPTVDTFPMTPRGDSHKLIAWLFSELQKVYNGEQEIPNELSGTPTPTPQTASDPAS
jgi:hypothetical protein